jgi:hypothetical protein
MRRGTRLGRGLRSRLLGSIESLFLFTFGVPFWLGVLLSSAADGDPIPPAAWVIGAALLGVGVSATGWSYRITDRHLVCGPFGFPLIRRDLGDFVSVRAGGVPFWPAELRGVVLVGGRDGELPLRYSALIGRARTERWVGAIGDSIRRSKGEH